MNETGVELAMTRHFIKAIQEKRVYGKCSIFEKNHVNWDAHYIDFCEFLLLLNGKKIKKFFLLMKQKY